MANGNAAHKVELNGTPRTIAELATALGVSAMTIHRAIAGKPDIAPGTRDRILAEIERLDWRPNIAARGLRQGRTYTLGILVSNVAASFLPEVMLGVDRAAEQRGYHTCVPVHEHEAPRAERHLRTMQSKGVDGIVHYPTQCGRETELLNQVVASTPVVGVMRDLPDFHGRAVLVDDVFGGGLAARHLLEQGHERFGILSYGDSDFSADRRRGFEAALREAGIAVRPEWSAEVATGDEGARDIAAAM